MQYRELDILNHFRLKVSQEKDRHFDPIKNQDELAKFILSNRHSKNNRARVSLPTSCVYCFDDHSQQVNPLIRCGKCGSRKHRWCKLLDRGSECSSCRKRSLTYFEGSPSQCYECVLCPTSGMAQVTTSCGRPVHAFCLLAFKLFQISEGKVSILENTTLDIG